MATARGLLRKWSELFDYWTVNKIKAKECREAVGCRHLHHHRRHFITQRAIVEAVMKDEATFRKDAAETWLGSPRALEILCTNRDADGASLRMTRRSPFDVLAKQPVLEYGVANRASHVPMVRQFVSVFNSAISPFIEAVGKIAC